MKKALLFSIWNILLVGSLWAQKPYPVALVPASTTVDLSAHFRTVSTVVFDYESLYQAYLQNEEELSFNLATGGKTLLEFTLSPLELRSKNYVRQTWDGSTAQRSPATRTPVYRGSSRQEPAAEAIFTFDEQFVLGRWEHAGTVYLLEPLWLIDPLASRDLYLLYRQQDAILPPDFCATHLPEEATPRRQKELPASPEKVGGCLLVELALASDFQLYQDFGSNATSVENFMLNTLANVQTNYDNEFADEILFEVVTTFIATCSATSCDPWTNSTNAGTLLNNFANWGDAGGFGVNYDMATLWTGRAFQGSTIGIAYLGGLCTDGRYHACENFGGSAQSLRVLWAHEIGHNFNASHDASGTFIMSPSVNTSTTWSAQSLSAINNFLPSRSCLSSCGVAGPPVAVIATPFDQACANSRIPFFDESEGTVTDRFWSFPGGNPATSTQANPVVTFPEPGVYTVSLNVDNAEGGDFTEYIIEIGFGAGFPKILFFDGFEQGTGSWNVSNPDNNITWQSTAVGGNFGSRAAFVNNFDYNAAGQIDALVSTPFDFSAEADIRFTMEYAYRRYSNTFNDELKIYLSTNGGTTFPNLLFSGDETGSGNFATGGDLTSAFTPFVADDWCGNGPGCIDLDLSAYSGQSNVVIKIENVTGFGNNMYVDNVAITTACENREPPTADFFHDPEVGCPTLVVNFLDQSTGVVSFREWTFPGGDPATSTELDPVVEYATPGTYGVTLYVENSEGSDTYVVPNAVTVLGGPTAAFSFTNNGTTFDFTNLSSANSEDFFWTFGDGNFSNEVNPVHTYTVPGTYNVLLEAFSACGSDSYTLTLTVEAVIIADFIANVTTGCAPLAVDFTDFSTGNPDSWEWTFSGGNPGFSNQRNPRVTYATPGRYSVSLTVGAGGVFETITFTDYIVVSGLPTAGFTASLAPGVATPQITNTATGATSYSWNFGNGQTATGANPSGTYLEAGTYTITQTATNSCGSTTATQTVTVIFPEEPTFTATTTSGCAPLTVDFSAEPQRPGLDYDWVFPGGSPGTSTLANPQVTYASPGDYDVSLTITNAAGAGTVTESQVITVGAGPAAAFQVSTTPGSLTVQLADLSANADEVSWDFGDGTVITNNPTSYTYTAAGIYTIALTATNACGTDVATQIITLILPVSPVITAVNANGCTPLTVTFAASPQAAGQTYAWTFPGGTPATSTAPNPTVVYNNDGQFAVTLEITNAGGSATVTESELVTVGLGPEAGFQLDYTPGQANVSFTNQSQGADQYSWFFGDGATASTDNATHTYNAAGDYEVVLVATNTCGVDTSRQTVSIVFLPVPAIQATATSGCTPLSVTYEAQPTGPGYTYGWTFPGGEPATSTAPMVTVSYVAAGSYTPTLTVTNAAGSATTQLATPTAVLAEPQIGFDTAYQLGESTATFTSTGTGATSLSWDFGDGATASGETVSHTFANAGTYTVSLTGVGDCGTVTVTSEITIVFPPTAAYSHTSENGCLPHVITFTAAEQGPGYTYAWAFPGGEPATSTAAAPVVSYNAVGLYSVSLTVTNAAGEATDLRTDLVHISAVPGDFILNTTLGSLTVELDGPTNDNVTDWQWDFGDGTQTTSTSPSHTYATAGTYTIRLAATNACGTAISEQTVTVLSAPAATFTSSTLTACPGATVQLAASEQEADWSYAWTIPGGMPASSTAASLDAQFPAPGDYTISLAVTNAAGTTTTSQTINVGELPAADFTASVNGLTVSLTNQSTNATTYAWTYPGGTSVEAAPTITFPTTGMYEISLVAGNACGSSTQTLSVTIAGQVPSISFNADTRQGCGPFIVSFSSNVDGANSIQWTFPGGTPGTSNEPNPVVTYTVPGTYPVTLAATNAFGTNAATQDAMITVLPSTVAGFTYGLGVTTATFSNTSTGAGSYLWTFPDGTTSVAEAPVFTFAGNGTYEVSLRAEGPCGVEVYSETVVIAGELPQAEVLVETTQGCAPFTVAFTDASTNAPTAWAWTFPGGEPATSTAANPTVTYAVSGTYEVLLAVGNVYGTTPAVMIQQIEVTSVPEVPVFSSATVDGQQFELVVTNPVPETVYSWDFGDGSQAEGAEVGHVFMASGTYLVAVTATNDCGSQTASTSLTVVLTSTHAPAWASSLYLAPNPTHGLLLLRATNWPASGSVNVGVVNALGQQLSQQTWRVGPGTWQQQLDLADLPAGTYWLQWRWNTETWTQKVIKM